MLPDFLTGVVAPDQPHQLLRMHVVAVGIEHILPRHRAEVGTSLFLVRRFGSMWRQLCNAHG